MGEWWARSLSTPQFGCLSFFFLFLSACSAPSHTHLQHLQGWLAAGPRHLRLCPNWLSWFSLTHASSHSCSPRGLMTSPLYVLQVARQVSRGSLVGRQGLPHPSLAAWQLTAVVSWTLSVKWTEPCLMPASRHWGSLAAAASDQQQAATGVASCRGTEWAGRSRYCQERPWQLGTRAAGRTYLLGSLLFGKQLLPQVLPIPSLACDCLPVTGERVEGVAVESLG